MSSRPVNTPAPPPAQAPSPAVALDVLLDVRRRKEVTLDAAVRTHGDVIYSLSAHGLLAVTAGDRQITANGTVMVHYVSLTPKAYEFLAAHRASFR